MLSLCPPFPASAFGPNYAKQKRARVGPSTPIRLAELKKVPRYYLSTFTLLALRDGKPLAEACPGGFMSLFAAFVPLVCANRDEVLWYDYEADFPPALAELSRRLAGAFPDGRG